MVSMGTIPYRIPVKFQIPFPSALQIFRKRLTIFKTLMALSNIFKKYLKHRTFFVFVFVKITIINFLLLSKFYEIRHKVIEKEEALACYN
ncbi:hypothetical protein BpHYR1_017937 [Brachionus plicatilis]|uniref:Uncharacterized protein n=1 Tax=Brachionus plicatilis TaxID=10195 RepID=A0A3M7Q0P4_BRAPC|nr:hypothetical protein BpHYR1_017937 [Brachionus plicatilis]